MYTEFAQSKIRFLRHERRELLKTWRKETDTLKKILLQSKRQVLGAELKQTYLNLNHNLN